jgi:large subunit ribosomal protein L22
LFKKKKQKLKNNKKMEVVAKLNYLRISARKVRLVVDLIRGKKVEQAQNILRFTSKRAALPLEKLLKSAMANAKNNFGLDENNFYISKILVNDGPKLKRFMPRARGQAYEIQKKTSHIVLVLKEIDATLQPKNKQKAIKSKLGKIDKIEEKMEAKAPEIKKETKFKFKDFKTTKKSETKTVSRRIFQRKAM